LEAQTHGRLVTAMMGGLHRQPPGLRRAGEHVIRWTDRIPGLRGGGLSSAVTLIGLIVWGAVLLAAGGRPTGLPQPTNPQDSKPADVATA
jgi:hypothetical protein